MREIKSKLKAASEMQRKIMLDIKLKHEGIFRLEAK